MVAKSSSIALPKILILGSPSVFFSFSAMRIHRLQEKVLAWEFDDMMVFAQTRTSRELHLVRTARATSIVIAEAHTLSLGALLRRCHFEEVALGEVIEFAMVSVTSTANPCKHVT